MTTDQHLSKNHGSQAAAQSVSQTTEEKCHRWFLSAAGRQHRVEISGSLERTVAWYVDDQLVAKNTSSQDDVHLKPGEGADGHESVRDSVLLGPASPDAVAQEQSGAGDLRVKFTAFGRPKRVTWYEGEQDVAATVRAMAGAGGVDLDPEPGSPAALRLDRIRQHPRRYAAVAIAGGVTKVVVPLLIGILGLRLTLAIPWPHLNLPAIPWPHVDLPSIPWPDWDLPSIPWPDLHLPHWAAPGWVEWLVDHVHYVWPPAVAGALAYGEIKRQRQQDALKARVNAEASGDHLTPVSSDDQGGDPCRGGHFDEHQSEHSSGGASSIPDAAPAT